MDVSEVIMEEFSAVSVNGHIVAPPSDMKKIVIPSPPSIRYASINPRPAVIYLTANAITPNSSVVDKLKAYTLENKTVFICPEAGQSAD